MNNQTNNAENKLIETMKKNDRLMLKLEWVIVILSCIVLFIPLILAESFPIENWKCILLILSGIIPSFIGFCFALKIEQVVGYYECKECGHRHIPTYKAVILAPHIGRTRKLNCPECGKKSWQKKVISKK